MGVPLRILPLAAVCLVTASCTINVSMPIGGRRSQTLAEVALRGEGDDKVLLLNVNGVISSHDSRSLLGGSPNSVDMVKRHLDAARQDNSVKALILRVNSPGGGVTASDNILHELKSFKDDRDIPVVAYFEDVAASGGYYISMCADEIVAHPTTTTGSIGVISVFVNIEDLMEKAGVQAQIIRSGKMKGAGMPFKALTEEQSALVQKMIDEYYGEFVKHVDEGRPKLTREQILPLADGRVYTANQALSAGLVDRVGYVDDAFERAKALAKIERATLVTYTYNIDDINRTEYSETGAAQDAALPAALRLGPGFEALTNSTASFLYLWSPN